MADDPKKRKQDAQLVAGKQQYEVRYFATKHGLTMEQARKIIETAGPSRDKADAMAKALKRDR